MRDLSTLRLGRRKGRRRGERGAIGEGIVGAGRMVRKSWEHPHSSFEFHSTQIVNLFSGQRQGSPKGDAATMSFRKREEEISEGQESDGANWTASVLPSGRGRGKLGKVGRRSRALQAQEQKSISGTISHQSNRA